MATENGELTYRLIHPMFIQPKGQLASGYACSITARHRRPMPRRGRRVIPDQAANVY
ncbi:hypothetical protein AB3662_14845 [Sorangium cellulosum]|uniref:hypothetical protein n=1 Tax=Sorangium cellulosum TaxID=56 RepID=UPI003D9A6298